MSDKATDFQSRWDYLTSKLEGVTWQFWTCHRGCQGCVSWEGDVATCEECGAKSADAVPGEGE